jgi:hypothetical protein
VEQRVRSQRELARVYSGGPLDDEAPRDGAGRDGLRAKLQAAHAGLDGTAHGCGCVALDEASRDGDCRDTLRAKLGAAHAAPDGPAWGCSGGASTPRRRATAMADIRFGLSLEQRVRHRTGYGLARGFSGGALDDKAPRDCNG